MSYLFEIISPDTNRKIIVGGVTYRSLLKNGKIPDRPIYVIDGKKCLKATDVRGQEEENADFDSPEAKIKALKEYKAQLDERKKARKAREDEADTIEKMRKLLLEEQEKNAKLMASRKKKKITDIEHTTKPKRQPSKPATKEVQVKKEVQEEHYEYDDSSSDTSGSSDSSTA